MKTINVDIISFTSTASVGTFVYLRRLFSEIKKMNVEDYKFIFYAQKDFDFNRLSIPEGSEIVRTPVIKNPLIRFLYEQTFFLGKLKQADYLFSPCFSVPFLSTSHKILVIHDLIPFILSGKYSNLRVIFIKIVYKLSAKFSNTIITVSENSKRDLESILGVPSEKIRIVYNFISPNDAVTNQNIDSQFHLKFGLTKQYFVNVSTLHPGKNVERLIRSFGLFCRYNDDYQLCIVGNKGWAFESIFQEVKKMNLEDRVIFTGYLSDEELALIYDASYGIVYVSLYEGFGIPPLEGFYHGKAAIVSNNSSLPEVVGNAGVYVNPTDEKSISMGFSKFIEEKELLERHVSERISKFNPHQITRKFLALFD